MPKDRVEELARLLAQIRGADLLVPRVPPKSNWIVMHDDDPDIALAYARIRMQEDTGKSDDTGYRNAFNNAIIAAHFAEPLKSRPKAIDYAVRLSRLEGEYLAKGAGEAILTTVGRNTELAGLVISTRDLAYPNGGKEEAGREAAERIDALMNGYVIVGSVNGTYYAICSQPAPDWQFVERDREAIKGLRRTLSRQ